ncbi:MAG: hypothetical protein WC700_00560 [Gemmatimonadaceae bacterium]|jgi:hypothetical protein
MLYEPRESINPRTFALRHALLEELKRRQGLLRDGTDREPLAALARALDVSYDASTRCYAVHGKDAKVEVPLEAFRCYMPRTDAAATHWQQEDEILRANRVLTSSVIDQLVTRPLQRETP